MTDIIDGKAFAAKLRAELSGQISQLQQQHQIVPGLAVVLVGEDPASQVYVRNKNKQAKEIGMNSFEHKLPADTSQPVLLELIDQLNRDDTVNGILVQLPLPAHIDSKTVLNAVTPEKDVDGFHPVNAGLLAIGDVGMVPCTPLGCLLMLRDQLGELSGMDAVVLGRSNIVGKPMAQLLINDSCTVTVAHSRTRNLAEVCRRADILVAAVGRPQMVPGDWVKPGACVIDVGINRISVPDPNNAGSTKTRLVGDVDFDSAVNVAGAITPVPGGVGPMTIACLLRNTLTAVRRQRGLE